MGIKELVKFVNKSDADFILLGGDFNVDPKVNANETTYQDVKNIMTNSIEEFFHKIEDWLTPKKASYANPSNTYSNKFKPVLYDYVIIIIIIILTIIVLITIVMQVLYDYIFHRAKGKNIIL